MRAPDTCESPRCRIDRETGWPQPRPAAPGLRLCWTCRDRLFDHLVALPGLHDDCEQTLARATGLFEKVAGSKTPGIPINEHAADARAAIRSVLASWAALIVEERGITAPASRTVTTLAQFLAEHLDWLAAHPAAADCTEETGDLVHAARRAANPHRARRIELGPCVEPDCTGVLAAVMRDRTDEHSTVIRCEHGHTWTPDQWLELGRALTSTTGNRTEGTAA